MKEIISLENFELLWEAELLDSKIIILASEPDDFFIIAKALSEVIFPFKFTSAIHSFKSLSDAFERLDCPLFAYLFGFI